SVIFRCFPFSRSCLPLSRRLWVLCLPAARRTRAFTAPLLGDFVTSLFSFLAACPSWAKTRRTKVLAPASLPRRRPASASPPPLAPTPATPPPLSRTGRTAARPPLRPRKTRCRPPP